MSSLRESLKRRIPSAAKNTLIKFRESLRAPPLEEIVLHEYEMLPDLETAPRLNLIIPSLAPEKAFGGVATGIDICIDIAQRTGAQLRVIVDDYGGADNIDLLSAKATAVDLSLDALEVQPRRDLTPRVSVRSSDVFTSFNWWTTLNVRSLISSQTTHFHTQSRPHLYIIQDYEPSFYPFGSTHMMARLAFDGKLRSWAIINSSELHSYISAQGHHFERKFVFEPKLSKPLRLFLDLGPPNKVRRILLYGRPLISRNCFPALEKGLKLWAECSPEFADWEVVSAGTPHPPIRIASGREVRSLGKLSLDEYGELLRSTAVGISLMASPHPSYPPLEMAHFGLRTITNSFTSKNLERSHENIIQIDDICPQTIASALRLACTTFQLNPNKGWEARSCRSSFVDRDPWPFLEEISGLLRSEVWGRSML